MPFYCNNSSCEIAKKQASFPNKGKCPVCDSVLVKTDEQGPSYSDFEHMQSILARTEQIANLGSWEWNMITDKVIWSQELYRIFGLNPQKPLPPFSEFYKFYHPDDFKALQESVGKTLESGEPYEVEVRIYKPNGELRYGVGRGVAKRDEQGAIIGLYGSHLDITDRKIAEKKLIDSEERVELALQTAKLGCFEWRPLDGFLIWDEQMHEIFDIPIDSTMDRNEYFASILHPDDRERVMTLFAESLSPENSQVRFANRFKILLKSGQVKHIFSRSIHFRNEKGEVTRLIGTSLDVTARMQAEEALKSLAYQFNALNEKELLFKVCEYLTNTLNTNFAFVGEIDEANSTFKVVAGTSYGQIIEPFEYALAGTPCNAVVEKGEPCSFEKNVQKLFPQDPKLKAFNIESYIAAPLIREGKIFGLIGVLDSAPIKNTTVATAVLDVFKERLSTELSKLTAEKSLKLSEERYQSLTEVATVGIAVHKKGQIVYMNPFGVELLEAPNLQAVIGKDIIDFIHEDSISVAMERIKRLYNSENIYVPPADEKVVTYKKNEKEFLLSGILIDYEGEKAICNVFSDISEIKEVQKKHLKAKEELAILNEELEKRVTQRTQELFKINLELREQKSQLQSTLEELKDTQQQLIQTEKMASLGTLTAGVAHELNNPLNFISGGAQGLENYIRKNFPNHLNEVDKILQIILKGVWRAKEIVQSLNHFSRKTDDINQNCDVHRVIENCLTMLQNQTKHKVEVHTEFTDEAYQLMGNESKLHQVFINLIGNAVQAIKEKGNIYIHTERRSSFFYVKIRDDGEGISKENITKIIDPFFTTKPPGQGTGLGVSIAYDIIQQHNGSIHYSSDVGVGTTVELEFPINKEKKEEIISSF